MGTEAEGQTADVTTPRTDEVEQTEEAQTPEATTEAREDAAKTGDAEAEKAADAASGLSNEPLQAGAEPELGSEV